MNHLPHPLYRKIRSFVKREGRLTEGQQRALTELWPRWGIDFQPQKTDFQAFFPQPQPLKLEIGFGNGEALCEMAKADPGSNYLGIEVHRPGLGHVLQQIEQQQLTNVRVLSHDAIEVLEQMLPSQSLATVLLFFPDPWHKKRHHKRRIVNALFRQLLARVLQSQGLLHMATDWQDYADWMQAELQSDRRFVPLNVEQGLSLEPCSRPSTRFERRGLKRGHSISDLYYQLR